MSKTESRRSTKDRFIGKVVGFLIRSLYREVNVYAPVSIPNESPKLNVANHFGGVSDALLLLGVLPDRPGIVARDVIWNVPVVGRLMNWIGAIPVHKPEDHNSPTSNDEMFTSCYDALNDAGNVLIFPEGVTRNEPSIATVKTGAARIAIGAQAHGVDGIQIVPIGIHYENKAALRSQVFINVGMPLRAAPDYEDWSEASQLATGAAIALRSQLDDSASEVPFALRDRLANTLADLPAEHRARICASVKEYQEDLETIGTTDAVLHARLRTGGFLSALVWQLIIGICLLPFVAVGIAVNVIPFLLVKAVGRLRVAPSMHSTIKPVVASLAFGITWGIVIWRAIAAFGWSAGGVAFILLPVYFAAVVLFVERLMLMSRAYRRWRAPGYPQPFSEQVAARRSAVVEAVLGS